MRAKIVAKQIMRQMAFRARNASAAPWAQGEGQKFGATIPGGAEAPRNSNVARIWVQAQRPPPQDIWQEGTTATSVRIENLATKLRLTNQSRYNARKTSGAACRPFRSLGTLGR